MSGSAGVKSAAGKPSVPGAKVSALATFASQLKAWRKVRGWSQIQLGQRINYSDALISGIENMAKSPTLDFARRLDVAFESPGTFEALHELVSREAWPSYFAPVIDFENQAVRVHQWEMRVVPGLLQTEEYARSVITAGKPRLGQAELERAVNSRLDRQQLLEKENAPMYWTVIHEGVLRHAIGSPAIMAAQLDKIIDAAESDGIVVQVLPFTTRDHPGTDGPMMVYDLADATSVAYMECKGGGMITETSDEVANLMTTVNLIRAAALPPRESINLLRQMRDEMGND